MLFGLVWVEIMPSAPASLVFRSASASAFEESGVFLLHVREGGLPRLSGFRLNRDNGYLSRSRDRQHRLVIDIPIKEPALDCADVILDESFHPGFCAKVNVRYGWLLV